VAVVAPIHSLVAPWKGRGRGVYSPGLSDVPCHHSCVMSILLALIHLTTCVSSLTSQPSSFIIVMAHPEGTINMPCHQHDMELGGVGVCHRQHSRRSFGDVASSWFVCTVVVVGRRCWCGVVMAVSCDGDGGGGCC
jgi:hypothetical protein